MPLLETLETRALFRLTRFVAFTIISVLTLVLVIGALFFFNDFLSDDGRYVGYERITAELNPTPTSEADSSVPSAADESPVRDDLRLPFALQPYFSDTENRAVLKKRLGDFDSSERTEYLSNLSQVVSTARKFGKSNEQITSIINKYFEDKEEQVRLAKLDEADRKQRQIYLLSGAVAIVGMIALASLILVLLAIERNTRVHIRDTV